jgi:hypothetical protein
LGDKSAPIPVGFFRRGYFRIAVPAPSPVPDGIVMLDVTLDFGGAGIVKGVSGNADQ